MSEQGQLRGATAAQLRDDIDSGRTGDKVPGFDPAAVPLGVDEQAGGASLSPAELAWARRTEAEQGPRASHPNAASPQLAPDARQGGGRHMMIAVLFGLLAAAAFAVALSASL